jgi:hypothetical protein
MVRRKKQADRWLVLAPFCDEAATLPEQQERCAIIAG